MDIWQIKQVKLGELIPNAKNPRKISQDKLAALQDKIERLGFHNPIKTDENMQVLGESHFAIHTFPEENRAYIELSSCVDLPFNKFKKNLKDFLLTYKINRV